MKHTLEKKVLHLLQKTVEKEVKRNAMEPEWPPICTYIIHQPKRPSGQGKS